MSKHAHPARRPLALLALAAAGALLAGCAGGGSSADPASHVYTPGEETVQVEFWSAASEGVNRELVDEFNATRGKELNIHVDVTYQGSYVEAEQKVYAAQIAGTLPGVFVDEVGMTASFADSGVALDLTPYLQANGMDDEDFQIGATGNLYVDERMHALPYMRSVPVMYVNRGLLAEHGFDPAGPRTLEELDDVLRTVSAATGKPALLLPNYDMWVMEALFYSYAGLPAIGQDGASTLGEPGAIATAEWIGDLIAAGAIKNTGPAELKEFIAAVGAPTTAITLTSSGGIQSLQELAKGQGIDLGVALFPVGAGGERGVSVGGANLYVADSGTDQEKAAAFEFARWATDTDRAAFVSASTGYIAVRTSSQDTELLKQTFAANPAYEVATEQLTYGRTRPMVPSYTEIQSLAVERIGTMWAQRQNPQEVMPALAKEVDAILAR